MLTNKPVELHIEGNIIKVKTWQDVFIKFLKYLKDIIDTNVDLSSRFKTFDGKVWNKVKDLDDDLIFIHINISASNCMTRVSNVMNKFNMNEESVKVLLR